MAETIPSGPKGGRPKIVVDWKEVEKLCGLHCTGEEIASFMEISYDTLNRRCHEDHDCGFADYIKQKSSAGKISLRRMQYATAQAGNVSMQIWLGKNWLGQSDQATIQGGMNITAFRVVSEDDE